MKLTPALCQRGVVGLTILFPEFRQGTGAEMRPVVLGSSLGRCRSAIRESSVKQRRRRRRRLRKRHLEVICASSNFLALIPSRRILAIFFGVEF